MKVILMGGKAMRQLRETSSLKRAKHTAAQGTHCFLKLTTAAPGSICKAQTSPGSFSKVTIVLTVNLDTWAELTGLAPVGLKVTYMHSKSSPCAPSKAALLPP